MFGFRPKSLYLLLKPDVHNTYSECLCLRFRHCSSRCFT